jgi:hypothetical protein
MNNYVELLEQCLIGESKEELTEASGNINMAKVIKNAQKFDKVGDFLSTRSVSSKKAKERKNRFKELLQDAFKKTSITKPKKVKSYYIPEEFGTPNLVSLMTNVDFSDFSTISKNIQKELKKGAVLKATPRGMTGLSDGGLCFFNDRVETPDEVVQRIEDASSLGEVFSRIVKTISNEEYANKMAKK